MQRARAPPGQKGSFFLRFKRASTRANSGSCSVHTGHPKPACAMCALTCLLCAMRFVMCAVRCAMCSLRKCSAQLATVRCAMCATFLRAKKRIHRQSAQRTEHKSKRKSKKCIARRRTHIAQRTSHATSHSAQRTAHSVQRTAYSLQRTVGRRICKSVHLQGGVRGKQKTSSSCCRSAAVSPPKTAHRTSHVAHHTAHSAKRTSQSAQRNNAGRDVASAT